MVHHNDRSDAPQVLSVYHCGRGERLYDPPANRDVIPQHTAPETGYSFASLTWANRPYPHLLFLSFFSDHFANGQPEVFP